MKSLVGRWIAHLTHQVELWAFYTHSPKRISGLIVSGGSLLRGSDLCGEQLSDFIIIVSIWGNSQPELGFYRAPFASKVVLSRLRNFMINWICLENCGWLIGVIIKVNV